MGKLDIFCSFFSLFALIWQDRQFLLNSGLKFGMIMTSEGSETFKFMSANHTWKFDFVMFREQKSVKTGQNRGFGTFWKNRKNHLFFQFLTKNGPKPMWIFFCKNGIQLFFYFQSEFSLRILTLEIRFQGSYFFWSKFCQMPGASLRSLAKFTGLIWKYGEKCSVAFGSFALSRFAAQCFSSREK